MSLREVIMAMQGCNDHEQTLQQFEWERCRWQTTLLLNVHTAKGKSLKPKDLVIFPWETEYTTKVVKRDLTNNDKTLFDKWDKIE